MPKPNEGEDKEHFMERCIPMVMGESEGMENDQAVAVCMSKWEEHMEGKSDDSAKYGNRNNAPDRKRIREARSHAQAIHDITMELEPSDEDQPEGDEIIAIYDLDGNQIWGKAMRVKIATDGAHEVKREQPAAVKSLKAFDEYSDPGWDVLGLPYGGPYKDRDADGETFHDGTQTWLNVGDVVPITYYHGFGPDDPYGLQESPAVIGRAKFIKADERGVWFDVRLDDGEPLAQRLTAAGPENVKASSGAVSHLVRTSAGGLIDVWPVGELALFDINDWRLPANDYAVVETRPIAEPQAAAAKTDGANLRSVKAAAATQSEGAQNSTPEFSNQASGATMRTENLEMTDELQDPTPVVPAAPVFDYKALAAELRPVIEETVKAQIEALPGYEKGAPTVMKAAQLGDPDPVEDFYNWVRTGEGKIKLHLNQDAKITVHGKTYKAALQEGTDSEGGYAVPADELGRIIEKRDEMGLLARLGAATFTTDRDVFNIPTEGTAMTKFTIVAEEGAISAAENEPTLGQAAVTLYNFKKLIKVSEELLEDYNSGLDTFLSSGIGRAWAMTENYYAQIGSGSGQPQGVFVGGTAGLTLDAAAAIGAGEVPELIGKLKIAYRTGSPGAVLVMSRTTAAYLAGLNSSSQFVFRQTPQSILKVDGEDLGIGYPVIPTEDAAAIGASAKSMLFGNFEFYGWVRNRSLRVRRLVELYAGNGQVGILANFRAGGSVLQAEAFQYATHPSA